jgi:hypothetical protein
MLRNATDRTRRSSSRGIGWATAIRWRAVTPRWPRQASGSPTDRHSRTQLTRHPTSSRRRPVSAPPVT